MSAEKVGGAAAAGDDSDWTTAPEGPQLDALSREAPVPPGGAPSAPDILPGSEEVPVETDADLARSADTPGDAVVEPPD